MQAGVPGGANGDIFLKLIERIRFLNDFDTRPEKRAASDDRPQRIILSSSYELPFGRGKMFAAKNDLVNRAIGGWVINGIYTYQTGAPLSTWGNVIFLGGNINFNPRQLSVVSFDTTRFNTNNAQQLANNVRTFPTQFGNLRQDTGALAAVQAALSTSTPTPAPTLGQERRAETWAKESPEEIAWGDHREIQG